jgi:hypothetical protein
VLFEPQDAPEHLTLSADSFKRLAAILRHAARLRQVGPVAVEEVTIAYAGTEWAISFDDQEREVWTDTVTGYQAYGAELTRGTPPPEEVDQ